MVSAETEAVVPGPVSSPMVDAFALSDVGTEREHNEDACAVRVEPGGAAVVVVADGVSSGPSGELASQLAVEVVLRDFGEEPGRPAAQRLYRAVQQANIEIYDKAVTVPELRGMCTTLTALAVEAGELTAVHVGDSRLYLVRDGLAIQLSKDHTVAAEKVRMGVLSPEKARTHPDKSTLTRSVGRELIVNRDRLSRALQAGDVLLLCTDGLHNVLPDEVLAEVAAGAPDSQAACRSLVERANALTTPDNLTVAVVRVLGAPPRPPPRPGLGARLRKLLAR
jgi:PPM family protein phosphatase